jgi:integrase
MRLPNGYGSVYKLSGKRRNPWAVRKTTGFKETGDDKKAVQPIYEFIGFYQSKKDALDALAEYNKNPYDIQAASITFSEVYDKWSERKFTEISKSNLNGYKTAYASYTAIYDMQFRDIKLDHLQSVVDNSGKNRPTLEKLKLLLSQLYQYAIMHEIVPSEKNVVRYVDISKAGNPDSIDREPFTKKEIAQLWSAECSNEYVSIVLMLIYSGLRISEMFDLKKEDVNLQEMCFNVIKSKTDAGIRTVPIAQKVLPLFEKWISKNDCKYVISNQNGKKFTYHNYCDCYWFPILESIGMEHRPHDTRHTCVSLLASAGVDDRVIKKIVGHKGKGVTQKVYTHFELTELLDAINKI